MISIVTPLMGVNRGARNRNWNAVYRCMFPLLGNDIEWVVPEQGSSVGARRGTRKVSVFGRKNRSQMRNIGWKESGGDMICFLDSDVVMERDAWRRAIDRCWDFDCYSPYTRGVYLGPRQTSNRINSISTGVWNFRLPPSKRWNLCGGISFIRRSVLESFDGWDERFFGWGYEDIAIEKLIRVGGFRWSLGRKDIAIHLWHPTTRGKRMQGRRMRDLYRREYSCRTFDDIVKRKRGVAEKSHLGGHANVTHVDIGTLRYFWGLDCRTMLDVGCGPGGQVELADSWGWQAKGLDGDDTISRRIDCQLIDFTKEKYEPEDREYDLAWCVEFVEHVRPEFIKNYMPALQSAKYVMMTHALPGKAGHHHVNCQKRSYWINVMQEHGLVYSPHHTKMVRQASTMDREFLRNTGMVFENPEFFDE